MSNILLFGRSRSVREEAARWLISIEEGLSPEEKAALEVWVTADAAHARALLEQARLWDDLGVLTELSTVFPLESHLPAPRSSFAATVGVLAASLAVLAVAVGLYFGKGLYLQRGLEPVATQIAGNPSQAGTPDEASDAERDSSTRRYATKVGERLTANLADGSVVTLNTQTVLELHFSATERRVLLLQGEATFEVAHDADRPFRVDAGDRIFQALGTVFNVERGRQGVVELTVTEGRVLMIKPTSPAVPGAAPSASASATGEAQSGLTVGAGQSALIENGVEHIRAHSLPEIERQMAWKNGMLIFRGERLADALAEVERYAPVAFVVLPELDDIRVGGYFRTGDVDGVLLALKESFGIESRRLEDGRVQLRIGKARSTSGRRAQEP
jgi:transmembrane sensor